MKFQERKVDVIVMRGGTRSAEEDSPREAFDVWFEADTSYRPGDMKSWIRELVEPEDFDVSHVEESARIEDEEGNHRAHWHCHYTAQQAVDEFAALRVLKLLTAAGFRLLRFDADTPAVTRREATLPDQAGRGRVPANERQIGLHAA